LITVIVQNHGKLSKNRRTNEFAKLTDEEVAMIEAVVMGAFAPLEDRDGSDLG